MIRLYHPEPLSTLGLITLSPEASHHLCTVLRISIGETLILFCGDGMDYQGTLSVAHKKNAQVLLSKKTVNSSESPLKIHVVQGLCKGEKMDLIIQKSVELGVTEITPLITERTQGNKSLKDPEWLAKKTDHYQKIVISACEQSGRSVIPKVHPTLTLEEHLKKSKKETEKWVLAPSALSQPIKNLSLTTLSVEFMVGPEGGLSPSEIQQAMNAGYQPLSLGPRILRTETAALACIAALQGRFGDF